MPNTVSYLMAANLEKLCRLLGKRISKSGLCLFESLNLFGSCCFAVLIRGVACNARLLQVRHVLLSLLKLVACALLLACQGSNLVHTAGLLSFLHLHLLSPLSLLDLVGLH